MPTRRSRHRAAAKRPALRVPQQRRSEDTLDRIVQATLDLLDQQSFDSIGVAAIAERARASVGSFYARFPHKEALLDYLDERYARDLLTAVDAFLDQDRWRDAPLAELVVELATFLLRFHRARPALLRALIVHARAHPEGRFGERTRRMNTRLPVVLELILSRADQIRHPDPAAAVALGFVQLFTAIREVVLFPESAASVVALSDERLAAELATAYLAYLRVGPKDHLG